MECKPTAVMRLVESASQMVRNYTHTHTLEGTHMHTRVHSHRSMAQSRFPPPSAPPPHPPSISGAAAAAVGEGTSTRAPSQQHNTHSKPYMGTHNSTHTHAPAPYHQEATLGGQNATPSSPHLRLPASAAWGPLDSPSSPPSPYTQHAPYHKHAYPLSLQGQQHSMPAAAVPGISSPPAAQHVSIAHSNNTTVGASAAAASGPHAAPVPNLNAAGVCVCVCVCLCV